MQTYTLGPELHFTNDVSKSDFVKLCELLTEKIGTNIVPEAISEGGFKFVFDSNTQYKSMRLCSCKGYKWPWLNGNEMADWADNNDILISAGIKMTTYLKAFKGAPIWTVDELLIFKDKMQELGIIMRKMPKKTSLSIRINYNYKNVA